MNWLNALSRHALLRQKRTWIIGLAAGLAVVGASMALALMSNNYRRIDGWQAFPGMLLACALLVAWTFRKLRIESPPRWLVSLTITAAVLHLAAGVLWMEALPRGGHGTPAERAGYVQGDAYARDKLAWRLADSGQPLISAFTDQRKADQYGGMLYLSAWIYRYLGAHKHQPLLVLLLAAVFSALAVPFTWAFAKLAWGALEAGLAAWGLALFPEVILLGSSQMREAFTMTLAAAAAYGLLRYVRGGPGAHLAWIIVPPLLCLPISPPLAGMILLCVAALAPTLRAKHADRPYDRRILWLGIFILILILLAGLFLALRQFTPPGMINPIQMLSWYFNKSAQFQGWISEHASGWMQKVFKPYPDWMKLPVLLGYGIVQPFLPAALVAGPATWTQAPVWSAMVIWRSLGWTGLMALLLYAPLLAQRSKHNRPFTLTLCLIVWLVVVVASVRGGGDMWDNPRYRATFSGLQVALASWAWAEHRRMRDPLFRRALITVSALLAWFLPWYLRRYTPVTWPVVDVFKTLGMGVATAFLLILWDWAHPVPLSEPVPIEKPAEASTVPEHG